MGLPFFQLVNLISQILDSPIAIEDNNPINLENEAFSLTITPLFDDAIASVSLAMTVSNFDKRIFTKLQETNFLGIKCLGCTFFLTDDGILSLKTEIFSEAAKEEIYERLNAFFFVAAEWKVLVPQSEQFLELTLFEE